MNEATRRKEQLKRVVFSALLRPNTDEFSDNLSDITVEMLEGGHVRLLYANDQGVLLTRTQVEKLLKLLTARI